MSRWDLVVAGAGPAGCALAAKVSARGASVLLLEKSEEPGAGRDWIVDVENSAFDAARVPAPVRGAVWHEPARNVMSSSDGTCTIDLRPAPLTPVRNDLYVKQLCSWAYESGVRVRMGCRVSGPVIEEGHVCGVRTGADGGEEHLAALVADCTGIGGTIRSKTPEDWGLFRAVSPDDIVLARREVRAVDADLAAAAVEAGVLPDRVRVDRTAAHGAYSVETTYLDLEAGYIDILVGIRPGEGNLHPDERFKQLLSEWGFIGDRMFGNGGPIPLRRPWDSLAGEGLLVLGDSACQVIPAHGSGTASALIAADLASTAVMSSLEKGIYDRAALWGYSRAFQSSRGALLAYYDTLRTFVDSLSGEDVDALLKKGVLSADEVFSGLVPEEFRPGPGALLDKTIHGLSMPRLLARFALVGLKARKVKRHFERYPESYSPGALARWAAGIPSYP